MVPCRQSLHEIHVVKAFCKTSHGGSNVVLIRVLYTPLGRLSHEVDLLGQGSSSLSPWIQLVLRLDRRNQGATMWENLEEKGEGMARIITQCDKQNWYPNH